MSMAAANRIIASGVPPFLKIILGLAVLMFMFFDASLRQTAYLLRPTRTSYDAPEYAIPSLSQQHPKPVFVKNAEANNLMCEAPLKAAPAKTHGGCPNDNGDAPTDVVSVWAYDAAPSHLNFPRSTNARVLCGNSECMELRAPCVHTERLLVQSWCEDTPIQDWCRFHVQNKLLSAHEFEDMLQIVMQLVAIYKNPGSIVHQPGVGLPKATLDNEEWIGTLGTSTDMCETKLLETMTSAGGFLSVKLSKAKAGKILESFSQHYYATGYNRTHWPLKVDWRDILGSYCHLLKPVRFETRPVAPITRRIRYGTLSYNIRRQYLQSIRNNGMNIGDEMQGLAGLQFLPYMDTLVERDNYTVNYATASIDRPMSVLERTLLFVNAWYGDSTQVWPPSPHLDPIYVAVHTESTEKTFARFDPGMEYMSKQWPVGVRDKSTHQYFGSHNVSNFISNCMTTTIVPMCPVREQRKTMFVVDTGDDFLKDMVPAEIIDQTTKVSHKSLDQEVNSDPIARYLEAFKMLHRYACEASLLITTRLHAALPSAASGTPIVWIKHEDALPGGGTASRVSDYYQFFHVLENMEDGKKMKWIEPPNNPNIDKREGMRNRLRVLAYCHHDAVKDAAVKFGTIPGSWPEKLDNYAPSCNVSGDTIQIAFLLNLDILKQDELLPSFIKSIAANHKKPIVVHVLTVGLNQAQQCIAKYMVQQPLPMGSSVHVLTMDECNQDQPLAALPTLLPCVSRVLWLNVKTRVLKPLNELYEMDIPKSYCGIAATETKTIVDSTIMVVSLDRFRSNSKDFFETMSSNNGGGLVEYCGDKIISLTSKWNVQKSWGDKSGWAIASYRLVEEDYKTTTAEALAAPLRDE